MKSHKVLIPEVVPTQYAFILFLKYVSVNEFLLLVKQVTVSASVTTMLNRISHHSFLLYSRKLMHSKHHRVASNVKYGQTQPLL